MVTPTPACVQEMVRLEYCKPGSCGSLGLYSNLRSLADSSALLLPLGWLSCCRMIYNHERDLQCHKMLSAPDGYSHIRSPQKVPLIYHPYTNMCLH